MRARLATTRRYALTAFRRHVLRYPGVHPTAYIAAGCRISRDVTIGPYSFVSRDCRICPRVELGRYVLLGGRVAIVGGDHIIDVPGTPMQFAGRPEMPRTEIEDDVWLGFGVIINAGVRVGRGAIVAAGSVATKDIPPYEIHGGVPCSKIRNRFSSPSDIEIHEEMLSRAPREGIYSGPKKTHV